MAKKITIEIKPELLKDLLVTAVEGGSNYWAAFTDVERDEELYVTKTRLSDREADTPRVFTVTPDTLAVGLQNLATRMSKRGESAAGRHLTDALTENGDAITADVVLQMALFGEIVYG